MPNVTQPNPVQVIEKFGKYEFLRKIGQGGMAEVFLARQVGDSPNAPPLVIKRLHQELERNQDAVDLFLTEADVTLLLSHPNVIRVYDSGEVSNRYYMAMEYVHGQDLEQLFDLFRQKSRRMPLEVVLHIMCEVLKGLSYIHQAKTATGRPLGIVHRDITPSNIYISSQGEVKVGDFGVAKLVGVEGWTMAGSIKGKLGYLSPEQIAGESPTQSIDLWSSGIILYELLAGARAFQGENELELMLRIKNAKLPKVRKINKEIPWRLHWIVCKALHRRERKRYQDAAEFMEALYSWRERYSRAITAQELVSMLRAALQ